MQLQKNIEASGKLKEYEELRKDFARLKEKHSIESETGNQFLNSLGKALLTNTGEKVIEAYRASSAFKEEVFQQVITIHDEVVVDCRCQLREMGLFAVEIIIMIKPSVLELGDGAVEDLPNNPLGDLLGELGNAEMIDALTLRPSDDANELRHSGRVSDPSACSKEIAIPTPSLMQVGCPLPLKW